MKNLIGLIILILVGIAAYFLVIKDGDINLSSSEEDFKDFAVEDTASVDKIFLSHSSGRTILLTRASAAQWMVNNKFKARTDAIELILKTFSDVKVNGVVPAADMKNTIKRLATNSTKVEIYTGGSKPHKTWYIGGPTASRLGTIMLLEKDGEKSSKPYITHMIMERGYLGTRFFVDETLWKDRIVMKCEPKEIKSVEVKHAVDTSVSFKIEQYELGKFKVTNLDENKTEELSPLVAIPYLKEFSGVYYEYIDEKTPERVIDSVYSALPRHIVRVTMNDNSEFLIKSYNMPVPEGSTLNGRVVDYHPERMYIYTNKLEEGVYPIVQNLTFDKLVPSLKYLGSSTTVEK